MLDQQRRDRLAGVGLGVLGVAVLAMAVVALRDPGGSQAASLTHPRSHVTTLRTSRPAGSTTPSSLPASSTARSAAHRSSGPPSSAPPSTPPSSKPPGDAAKLPLVVLNNTTTTGLAASAETRFEAGGWTVTSIATMSNDIISTCAYFDPSVAGAEDAAKALQAQFPWIKRVAPRFPELAPGPVVVVLTWDYQAG